MQLEHVPLLLSSIHGQVGHCLVLFLSKPISSLFPCVLRFSLLVGLLGLTDLYRSMVHKCPSDSD
uniref:Uncharacterized protein n=1 Tax=Tetranychus urticae TaxID=32264 RepID=T1KGF9_TETUR